MAQESDMAFYLVDGIYLDEFNETADITEEGEERKRWRR
jgi:hypothetical protein